LIKVKAVQRQPFISVPFKKINSTENSLGFREDKWEYQVFIFFYATAFPTD
jgi:hypothetical protein